MRDLLEKIDIIINEKEKRKSKEEEGKEASDFFSGRSASEYDKNLYSLVKSLPDNPSWKQINSQMDKALGLDSPGFSFDQEETNKQNFMKMLGKVNGLAKILVPGGYVIDTKTGKKQSYHELKGTSAFKKILSAQNAKGMIPVEFQTNKEIMADLGSSRSAVAQTPSKKTATDLAIGQQSPGDATTLAAKRNDATGDATTLAAKRYDATPPTSQSTTGDATTLALGQQTANGQVATDRTGDKVNGQDATKSAAKMANFAQGKRDDATPPTSQSTPGDATTNDQGAKDSTGDSIKAQLATKQQPITPDNILLQTGEFIKVLNQLEGTPKKTIVNLLKNKIPELGSATKAQKQQGPNAQIQGVPGGLPGNQQAIRALQGTTDKTNPPSYDATKSWKNSEAGLNQYDSTDFNNLLRLAGTQKLTEASMNISMTGNTSSEVRELMDILKNAGMDGAMPVKDLDMFKSTDEPAPCPHCAAMHGMDSPCGEAVEEEWDNSPDEQYQDDEYMMHDLSGGINRKKERAAQRVKDPAVAYESKFKSMLKSSLEEMYQKIKGQ